MTVLCSSYLKIHASAVLDIFLRSTIKGGNNTCKFDIFTYTIRFTGIDASMLRMQIILFQQ